MEIALRLLDDANRWGVAKRLLLVDAGYGEITEFREAIASRGYPYIVGMGGDPVVWMPGTAPDAPGDWRRPRGHSGPARTRYRDGKHSPVSLLELANSLGREACRSIRWREGAKGTQRSRFGAVRVRTAHKHTQGRAPGPEEWFLYEWPADEPEPTKFWLSNLPSNTPLQELVRLAKLRWRVERDELKEELGLDHFEGRSWRQPTTAQNEPVLSSAVRHPALEGAAGLDCLEVLLDRPALPVALDDAHDVRGGGEHASSSSSTTGARRCPIRARVQGLREAGHASRRAVRGGRRRAGRTAR